MDANQAKEVLASAKESAEMHQWGDTHHLLHKIYTEHVLTGTDQGDAAYLLGVAAIGTGDWDAAAPLLTEASTSASNEYRAEAKKRLGEIQHHTAAMAAEADQDVTQKESGDVLAAADEAAARGDYDGALAHYTAIYNGHADPARRAKAALGIANTLAHKDELDHAKQYAEYVTTTGVADAVAGARTLLQWIAGQQAAMTAAADGTSINEYAAANEAAKAAFYNNDYARARTLLASIASSEQVGTIERAKAWLNIGVAEMELGMLTEARLNLDLAASHGQPSTVEKANKMIARLERHDHADALVAEFEE